MAPASQSKSAAAAAAPKDEDDNTNPASTTAASASSALPVPPLAPPPRPTPKTLLPGFELTRPTLLLAVTDLLVYASGFALWTAAPVRRALGPLAFLLPLTAAGSLFAPGFDAYSPALAAALAVTTLCSACVASAVGLLGMYLTQQSPPAAAAVVLAMGAAAAFGGNFVPVLWASVFTMAFVWSTLLTCAGFALAPLPTATLPAFPASLLKSLALAQGLALFWRVIVGPLVLGTPSHAHRYALELDDATAALERALALCASMVERWAAAAGAGGKEDKVEGGGGGGGEGGDETPTTTTNNNNTALALDASELQQAFAAAAAKVEALARRTPLLVIDRALLLRGKQGQRAVRLSRAAGGLLQATQFLGLMLAQLGRAEGRVRDVSFDDEEEEEDGDRNGGKDDEEAASLLSPAPPPPAGERANAAARAVRALAPQLQRVIADARLNLRAGRERALGAADAASSAAPWYRTRQRRQQQQQKLKQQQQQAAADLEAGGGDAAASAAAAAAAHQSSSVPADRVVEGVDELEGAVLAALRSEGLGTTSQPSDVLVTSLLLSANSAASFLASAALAFAWRGEEAAAEVLAPSGRRRSGNNLRVLVLGAWNALVAGGGGGVFAPNSANMSTRPRRSAAVAAEAKVRAQERPQRKQQLQQQQQQQQASAAAPIPPSRRPARTGGAASIEVLDRVRGSGGGAQAEAEAELQREEEEARRRAEEEADASAAEAGNGASDTDDSGDSNELSSDDGEPDPFAAATTGHRSGFSVISWRRRARSRSPSPRSPSPSGRRRAALAALAAASKQQLPPPLPSSTSAAERRQLASDRAAAAARARARRRQAAHAAAASGRMGRYVVGGPDRGRGLARAAALTAHESTKAVLRAVVAFVVVALICNTLRLPQLTFVNAFLGASFVFSGAYLGKATFVFWMRVTMIVPGILLAWATYSATGGDLGNRWACWAMAVGLASPLVMLARVPLLGAAFGFASLFVLMPIMLYQLTAAGAVQAALRKNPALSAEVARALPGLVPTFFQFGARTFAMTAIGALIGLMASYCVSPVLAADKARDAVSAAGYRLAFALLRLRVVATAGVARRLRALRREEEERGKGGAADGGGDGNNDTNIVGSSSSSSSSNKGPAATAATTTATTTDDNAENDDWASHPLGSPEEVAALDAAARGVQALCESVHGALAPMPALSFFASLEPGFRGPWRPDLYARVQASLRACATLTAAWVHCSAVENRRRWSRAELLAAAAVNEQGSGVGGLGVGVGGGGGGGGGGGAGAGASSASASQAHGASPFSAAVLRLTAGLAALESGRPLTLYGVPPAAAPPAGVVVAGEKKPKAAAKKNKPLKPPAVAMRAQARTQAALISPLGADVLAGIVRLNDDALADVVAGCRPSAVAGGRGRGAANSNAAPPHAPPPLALRHDWLATSHGRHAMAAAALQLHLRAFVDEALRAVQDLLGAADGRLLLGAEALAGLAVPGGGGHEEHGFWGSSLSVSAVGEERRRAKRA
jgi:hypothetical protein